LRILGVDPGTLKCGYGIIEADGNGKFTHVSSGVINITAIATIPNKLEIIFSHLQTIIKKHHPDEFAIETAFYGKNVQSALKIGMARGAAIVAARQHKLDVSEYAPREVKKAVTGNGAASKEQVAYMVKTILSLRDTELKLDESDALGVALCHAFRRKQKGGKSKSWKSFVENYPERIVK
jgi:crossover junction endodeoxyribonuclease RuvC